MLLVLEETLLDSASKYSPQRLELLAMCSTVERRWCATCARGIVLEASKADAPACWPNTQDIPEVGLQNMEMVVRCDALLVPL